MWCPITAFDERLEAVPVARVATHRVGVDAQCESRVGVSELAHDGRRVLAAHVEDGGEGVAQLVRGDTPGERGLAAFGEQLVGALDHRADDTLASVVLVARRALEVGKTRSSGFATGWLARWAVSSSCSAGTMSTIRSLASVFDRRTVIWPAASLRSLQRSAAASPIRSPARRGRR